MHEPLHLARKIRVCIKIKSTGVVTIIIPKKKKTGKNK
jgi:hypothetical protein